MGFDPYATNVVQIDTDECRLLGRTLYRLTAVHLPTRYCFSQLIYAQDCHMCDRFPKQAYYRIASGLFRYSS